MGSTVNPSPSGGGGVPQKVTGISNFWDDSTGLSEKTRSDFLDLGASLHSKACNLEYVFVYFPYTVSLKSSNFPPAAGSSSPEILIPVTLLLDWRNLIVQPHLSRG